MLQPLFSAEPMNRRLRAERGCHFRGRLAAAVCSLARLLTAPHRQTSRFCTVHPSPCDLVFEVLHTSRCQNEDISEAEEDRVEVVADEVAAEVTEAEGSQVNRRSPRRRISST